MSNLEDNLKSNPPNNGRFYTVAIDGRGGSGKTTLAALVSKLLPSFVYFNGDDYFEPTPNKVEWGAFNDERFITEVVEPLKRGDTIVYRPYDWHKEPPITPRDITVKQGLFLERVFSFKFDLNWDLKIWVETPRSICFVRGTTRERLPKETVIKTWRDIWQPLEDVYINETNPLKNADIVLDGTKPFDKQID